MKNKLLPCPFCGNEVEIHGGVEKWTPTFYDPDSGGDPYYINCKCGVEFSIGYCDAFDLIKRWNTRKPMERIAKTLEDKREISLYRDWQMAYGNVICMMNEEGVIDAELFD